jgi:hypothetical protein
MATALISESELPDTGVWEIAQRHCVGAPDGKVSATAFGTA